eukprot:2868950-Amphidinium_carterae.4
MSWVEYMVATESELESELAWSRNRPSVRGRADISESEHPDEALPVDCSLSPLEEKPKDTAFYRALSKSEQQYLEKYHELCNASTLMQREHALPVVMLGQNPSMRPMHNAGKSVLQTVIKNCHLMYSLRHGRWLTPRELLLAQAFPVAGCAGSEPECSFGVDRSCLGLPPRRSAHVFGKTYLLLTPFSFGTRQLPGKNILALGK